MKFPQKLMQKIEDRKQKNAFRMLPTQNSLVDFASNDYLGFSKSASIFQQTHDYLKKNNIVQNGATGSRLLSGNHQVYQETETFIARFHQAEAALLFNSGYDANIGFFSSVCQKGDIILFDELSHASIRDGIGMSNAQAIKFKHNDYRDLQRLIFFFQKQQFDKGSNDKFLNQIYIATESVFSMDGDTPNLEELVEIANEFGCYLIVDEAHALGVVGEFGKGLVQEMQLQNKIFARIITFGKGLGCHGAAILGSHDLRNYLINFARSFIYTTGLSPHAVATILIAYQHLESNKIAIQQLKENVIHFNQEKNMLSLKPIFIRSKSAIHCAIIPGNEKIKAIASDIQQKGFDVKAILSPTVPEGQERLRFCLHSYNTKSEISEVLNLLLSLI
jgi:8-amino-7-oxononanoate synthase